MTAIKIEINDRPVIDALNRLAAAGRDLTPAMRAIAMVLLSQSEENFAAEAGPLGKWPDLAPATKKARAKEGKWPGKKLQVSGKLTASVTPFWSADEAGVGSNAIQAAIQHLGGNAGRNLAALIPARPYLPALADGTLQAGAEDQALDAIQHYLLGN